MNPRQPSPSMGFSLIELMIVVAILGIVVGLAIPAYNGYMGAARQGTTDTNLETLRLFLEDYALDNGTYVAGTYDPSTSTDTLSGPLGWLPEGDDDKFVYKVTACGSGTIATCYKITMEGFDGTVTAEFERDP